MQADGSAQPPSCLSFPDGNLPLWKPPLYVRSVEEFIDIDGIVATDENDDTGNADEIHGTIPPPVSRLC